MPVHVHDGCSVFDQDKYLQFTLPRCFLQLVLGSLTGEEPRLGDDDHRNCGICGKKSEEIREVFRLLEKWRTLSFSVGELEEKRGMVHGWCRVSLSLLETKMSLLTFS